MSYTAPAGNAADFHFAGAYIAPDGDRADLLFETGVLRAKGIISTRFGAPLAPNAQTGWSSTTFGTALARMTAFPSGWETTAFGPDPRLTRLMPVTAPAGDPVVFGTPNIIYGVQGFSSTSFGLANSPYLQTGVTTGAADTAFGTARLTTVCRTFGATPSTTFSTAYYATNQTVVATGQSTTAFGTPAGSRRLLGGGILCQAESSATTSFGTPAASWPQPVDASAFSTTVFGTPTGFRADTRFVTGFNRTRFGNRHYGVSRFDVRYVSSAAAATGFGTPSSAVRNRVTAIEPVCRLGTPLLTRSTTC